MTWFQDAACRHENTVQFFDYFEKSLKKQRLEILALCKTCPVKQECKNYAESFPNTYGLWGGAYYKNGMAKDPLKIAQINEDNQGD